MADSSTKDSFACWDGFDVMFDRAFAPADTPHDTPILTSSDLADRNYVTPSRPHPQDSSEDSMGPPTPVDRDYESLSQLWDTLRDKKARQMAKEVPKVKSLEECIPDLDRDVVQYARRSRSPSPILEEVHRPERPKRPEPKQKIKKRKSMCVCLLLSPWLTCDVYLPFLQCHFPRIARWPLDYCDLRSARDKEEPSPH